MAPMPQEGSGRSWHQSRGPRIVSQASDAPGPDDWYRMVMLAIAYILVLGPGL